MAEAFKQAQPQEAQEIKQLQTELAKFDNGDEVATYDYSPFLGDYYFLKDVPDNEVKNDLMLVDKFIKEKIKDDNLEPTKESYQNIIKEIEKAVGVKKGEMNWSKLQKLSKYAKTYFEVKSRVEKINRNLNKTAKIDKLEVLLETLLKL